ncbi:MAG: helix-turn-helix domain-containing protein [Alphaproteobacteria bacterium]|nr:helix-turn-helix domain-containing protein [Alphaproteobacteria bacterium]
MLSLAKQPLAYTVEEFCALYGVRHTKAYELMKTGAVERVKIGAATRITRESAERWFASLPRTQVKGAA